MQSKDVWLLEVGLADRVSTKWPSVWMIDFVHAWPHEHTLNMTWRQDPSNQQDNIHLVWLIDGVSDKRDTCDRSSNDHDDACVTVHTTLCVSATDVYIKDTTCTHTGKTCTWPKHDSKCNIVTNMPKYVRWTIKRWRCKDSTWAHRKTSIACKHQIKTQGRLWNWMHAKIFEGVVAARTLCETLVELQILVFGPFTAQGPGLLGSIESLCGLLRLPHLPHG